jgi:hypothetical protein
MLDLTCPSCQKLLQVAENSVDRDSQCPACATVFRPAAVWRGDSPFITNTPRLRIGTENPESSPQLDSEMDSFPLPEPQFRRAGTNHLPAEVPEPDLFGFIRVGIIGFAAGCGVGTAYVIRIIMAFPGSDQDLSLVPVMGVLTAIQSAAYAFLLACLNDPMHRRIVQFSGRSTMGIVSAGYVGCFFFPHPSDPFILAITWFTPIIAIGCYLIVGVASKSLIGLQQMTNGLFKAAGRPTKPAARDQTRRFLNHNFDEGQP